MYNKLKSISGITALVFILTIGFTSISWKSVSEKTNKAGIFSSLFLVTEFTGTAETVDSDQRTGTIRNTTTQVLYDFINPGGTVTITLGNNYIYILIRRPGEQGDMAIVIRIPK